MARLAAQLLGLLTSWTQVDGGKLDDATRNYLDNDDDVPDECKPVLPMN